MSDDPILYENDGAIARITLNRPDAFNAMDPTLREGLREAILNVHENADVRTVIISGAGRGFCSGTDLKEGLSRHTGLFLEQEYRPILASISASPKIWISQVHGSAAGIGAALAMNCDMMVMAESANIYMAFAAINLIPDGGNTWLLQRGLGYKRALQTILEARRIPASEAVALGLANEMHPDDDLAQATTALATRIAAGPPLATAAAKRLLRAVDGMSYADAIGAEGTEQTALAEANDTREGVAAFFEKRKPNFTGT
ncbi:enoyl-CoA hydratase-related protein [Maritimibacter sp. UBA3975]|uniref:enoyl-CoA hydratase/isomerase family protein n=1 Tax=Maritimibacter sp. UBA3975 TaxID=1946833 RepID=UPI000C0904AC|nr:enoyl-CoA hydratase-related protein [Maritimibacter sp. UBA3975]MAM60341.1 enoyl-CoA hydratase [Maritimibacter sp.]|tara:strand:+ start:1677 stop:2450 length:774 start_codon:yes stop_codon:yes gene_type:complete